jgi:hypothetical protein
MDWDTISEDLPAMPLLQDQSWPKLAKKLKRKAAPMTAGRYLHDIHSILYLVAAWDNLTESAIAYATHRMRLLYIVVTKGWLAALYYDQQRTDEFPDLARTSGSSTKRRLT